MKFCSQCGSAHLQWQVPSGDNRARQVCSSCQTIHYSNPNIVAGCLAVWEDKVLLCRRAIEPRVGYWNIPSGYLENGETVEEGAARELWEEAQAKISTPEVLSIYSLPHINQVYIHLLGDLVDGLYGVGAESLESRLFTEAEIPWEEIAFTSSVFSLQRYFADRQQGKSKRAHLGAYLK
ncbi:MAG: NUDIX hydrolase [Bacteroidetes bacterium]|nr:MAG: NUDIX hydrolase [Bacteroidota bacterium]